MEDVLSQVGFDLIVAMRSELGREWRRDAPLSEPFNRIYFIESGSAFIAHGGLRREMPAGTLHLIPANTPLRFGCEDRFCVRWTHFSARAQAGFDIVPHLGCALDIAMPSQDIAKLFSDLFAIGDSPRAGLRGRAALPLLLSEFMDGLDARALELRFSALGRFRAVLEMLDARASEPPSVNEMASAMGMAPASFSRLFKASFGASPGRFSMERRLERSKRLLEEGLLLDEIALRLGFSDAFHFSKAFKSLKGMSPSEYRKGSPHGQFP